MCKYARTLLSAMLLIASAVVSAQEPNAVVTSAVDELVVQLDGRLDELAADKAALYATIDAVLLPRFDRRFAAQLVLAKHWRTASAEQRDRFIEAFYQALLRRYADGLLEFEQDRIRILPFRGDLSKRRSKVRSTVQLNTERKLPLITNWSGAIQAG